MVVEFFLGVPALAKIRTIIRGYASVWVGLDDQNRLVAHLFFRNYHGGVRGRVLLLADRVVGLAAFINAIYGVGWL